MPQVIQNLEEAFMPLADQAAEVHGAVAFATAHRFFNVQKAFKHCPQRWVFGTDLPTSKSVFAAHDQDHLQIKVLEDDASFFHPKVYVIRLKSGELTAFVGSGNMTGPGWSANHELFVEVRGEDAQQVLDWFETVWDNAAWVSQAFLDRYVVRRTGNLKRDEAAAEAQPLAIDQGASDAYFTAYELSCFEEHLQTVTRQEDPSVHARRRSIADKLKHLHDHFWEPWIRDNQLNLEGHEA